MRSGKGLPVLPFCEDRKCASAHCAVHYWIKRLCGCHFVLLYSFFYVFKLVAPVFEGIHISAAVAFLLLSFVVFWGSGVIKEKASASAGLMVLSGVPEGYEGKGAPRVMEFVVIEYFWNCLESEVYWDFLFSFRSW